MNGNIFLKIFATSAVVCFVSYIFCNKSMYPNSRFETASAIVFLISGICTVISFLIYVWI